MSPLLLLLFPSLTFLLLRSLPHPSSHTSRPSSQKGPLACSYDPILPFFFSSSSSKRQTPTTKERRLRPPPPRLFFSFSWQFVLLLLLLLLFGLSRERKSERGGREGGAMASKDFVWDHMRATAKENRKKRQARKGTPSNHCTV